MNQNSEAGEFSSWLSEFIETMKGNGKGDVPCGDCVGCCTSSKFIHVRPTDRSAIKKIPEEILFQAPGLPDGHYLLGYDGKGHCPMFIDGGCTIYESRPETCKQYDCRVLASSGLSFNEESQPIIGKVTSWKFSYSQPDSLKLSEAIQLAARFLTDYASEFPPGVIPPTNSQRAVMAIRIHKEFLEHTVESIKEKPATLIEAVVSRHG